LHAINRLEPAIYNIAIDLQLFHLQPNPCRFFGKWGKKAGSIHLYHVL